MNAEELLKCFYDEKNILLKNNLQYNIDKSNLYFESQSKIIELEKKWNIKKNSYFKKFIYKRNGLLEQIKEYLKFKSLSSMQKLKINEINKSITFFKEEYKKNIKISADIYNESYLLITDFYANKLEKLKEKFISSNFNNIKIDNKIDNDILLKEKQNVEKLKLLYSKKLEEYNKAVKIFFREKEKLEFEKEALYSTHISNISKEEELKNMYNEVNSLKEVIEKEKKQLDIHKEQFEREAQIEFEKLQKKHVIYKKETLRAINIKNEFQKKHLDYVNIIINFNINSQEEAEKFLNLQKPYVIDDLKKSCKILALKYNEEKKSEQKNDFSHFYKHMHEQINKSYELLKYNFLI